MQFQITTKGQSNKTGKWTTTTEINDGQTQIENVQKEMTKKSNNHK